MPAHGSRPSRLGMVHVRWRRVALSSAAFLAIVLASSIALATDGKADAKEEAAAAYDRGASAYDRGDFKTAAIELARADELAQSAVTLELAINAAIRADDAALGMTLADRATQRKGTSSGSAKADYAAENARKKLGAKVGRLSVVCASSGASGASSRCTAALDGASFETGSARYVAVGKHRLSVTRASSATPELFDVTIEPGKTVELIPAASAPIDANAAGGAAVSAPVAPVAARDERRGLSPVWFWVAAGATAIGAGVSVVSGLDTKSKHDAFVADRSSTQASNDGKASEQRTILLLAGTGVLAVATAALGLFAVDWRTSSSAASSARPKLDVAIDRSLQGGQLMLGGAL